MDQLRAMRVFVSVAERGGFAAAGRSLGLSPPTVSRAVEALEAHLGVVLLRRTTRALSLTEEGARYLDACRRVLSALDEADRAAAGARSEPRGRIAVTAPVQFGKLHVAPLVLEFTRRHPAVTASLALLDRPVNLVEEGFDLGVRIGPLDDGRLVATRLGTVRAVVCASPGYLARRGLPETPSALVEHDLIELSAMSPFGPIWRFADEGRDVALRVAPRLTVDTTDVAVAAAAAGHGLTRVLSYQVAEPVSAGRLRIVLERFERPPIPVSLLFPAGRPSAAAVRDFADLVKKRLPKILSDER